MSQQGCLENACPMLGSSEVFFLSQGQHRTLVTFLTFITRVLSPAQFSPRGYLAVFGDIIFLFQLVEKVL
jgi:hypothetical protein